MTPADTPCDVLIIEDDFGIRDAITQILEDEGYQIMGATNGMEALDYLRGAQRRPQLILLDLTLPIISGWQFLATYRDDPALSGVPVIIMSADSTFLRSAAAPPGGAAPAVGYLQKPIEITTLLDVVERFCRV